MLAGVIKLVSYIVEDGKPAHYCILLLQWDIKQALSVDFSVPSSPSLFWSDDLCITFWHLDESLLVHRHPKSGLRFDQY